MLSLREAREFLSLRQERNVEWLPHIDILGELNTSEAELDSLGSAISLMVSGMQPRQATWQLESQYPLAFAEFLVAVGIHDYRQGNYWSAVRERTGIPAQVYPSLWGEAFERILRRFDLEQFERLQDEQATRFVSRFLAHGGIPTSCLNDFFQHLIEPAVRNNRHASLKPQQIIDAWRGSPTAFDGVDKPVRRFLLYGGPVARDVLARTLDLADSVLQGVAIPEASDLGLPSRFVDSFALWASDKLKKNSHPSISTRRMPRPSIIYDPWAPDALNLLLPPEPLSNSAQSAVWSIAAGSWTGKQVVSRAAQLASPVTRASEIRIADPFSVLEVEFGVNGERVRSWAFTGISPDRPFLAFHPSSGQMLDPTKPLPASDLILVTPRSSTITVDDGNATCPPRVLEEFPLLSGGWAGYKGLHTDLGGGSHLSVSHDKGTISFDLVDPDDLVTRPSLVGGARPDFPIADDGWATYLGSPPQLRLPRPVRGGSRLSPDRWRIRVRSLGSARPQLDKSFPGEDQAFVAETETGSLSIDLANDQLLGKNPIGQFEITARGPLGHDGRFDLMFLPSTMRVSGTSHMLVPSNPFPIRIRGLTQVIIASNQASKVNIVPESSGVFRIEAPDDIETIRIVGQLHPQEPDQLYVTLKLHRMGWTLTGVGDHHSGLSTALISISRDELEQSPIPSLFVSLPGASDELHVGLDVEDSVGSTIHSFTPRLAAQGRRFSLREILDSIKTSNDPRLRLVLALRRGEKELEAHRIPAGYVVRNLRIDGLTATDSLLGLERTLNITWEEPLPVSNRVVRLWNLWRLWEKPFSVHIPDSAVGEFNLRRSSFLLPPGKYRVELVVRDPWIGEVEPSLPGLDDGRCTDVMVGTLEERAEYLADLPNDDPLAVLEKFLAEGDLRLLRLLPETMSGDRVHLAIRALLAMVETDDADSLIDERELILAMGEIRRALLSHRETLDSIADEARFASAPSEQLRRLIVELGILEEPGTAIYASGLSEVRRRALWHLWPPLLSALDGELLITAEPEVMETAANVLGRSIVNWLPGVDGEEACSSLRQPIFTFQGTELGVPAHQLSMMRDHLSLLPSGPLDSDAWTLANFDWLIRVKGDPDAKVRAESWLEACLTFADDDLESLLQIGVENAVQVVCARQPTADLGLLRMVPYVVGATALACRALARGVVEKSRLIDYTPAHIAAPREAFVTAPELFTRDLCVMDLLLLDWLTKRGT